MAESIGASLVAGGASIANTLINQAFAEGNRKQNYYWNEKAADAADQRQRKQYHDLYSPQAMLKQYAAAGLSPSMMMSGGQSAVGGTPQGAQGGISGPYPSAEIFNPQTMADLALKRAQIRNLDEDTTTKELENSIKKLETSLYKDEWNFLYNRSFGIDGQNLSWSEIANRSETFDEFKKLVNEFGNMTGDTHFIHTDRGQQLLKQIYTANKTFDNEIAVLANSEKNANLMNQVTELLNNNGFANASADAQIKQLKQISESAELSTEQKKAFNNLIDKLGNGTFKDIAIVLLMAISNFAHANLNFGMSQSTMIKK